MRWEKPRDGWVALNTNGSVDGKKRRVGSRGVLRDWNGKWLTGFSLRLGNCTIAEAKAWAILKGLEIAWDKGMRKVHVMCDSKKLDCEHARDNGESRREP